MTPIQRLFLAAAPAVASIALFAAPARIAARAPVASAVPILADDDHDPTPLDQAVDDFWHLSSTGNWESAKAAAEKILAADPTEVMKSFNFVRANASPNAPKDLPEAYLLHLQAIPEMKETARKLYDILLAAHQKLTADPKWIEEGIALVVKGQGRAYELGMQRLAESGETCVPYIIRHLQNAVEKDSHYQLQKALRDLGRSAVNPLLAALEMKDATTLVKIVWVIEQLDFRTTLPYLLMLANDPSSEPQIKAAAMHAVKQIDAGSANAKAEDLFFSLAERLYYNQSTDLVSGNGAVPAKVWNWIDNRGLVDKDVPPQIFNDCMAMRSCEYILKLDGSRSDAVSLWLASNYKRESELAGGVDPTHTGPDADYYGTMSGAKHLNGALARALKDQNAAVASRAIDSLSKIIGKANTFDIGASQPIMEAMQSGDRIVRIKAAIAVGLAFPDKPFNNQQMLVPILAEAVGQTGKPGILLLAGDSDFAKLKDAASKAGTGYNVVGAASAAAAVTAAASMPAVDFILVQTSSVDAAEVGKLSALAGQTSRLATAPRILITADPVPAEEKLLTATRATDTAGLAAAFAAALQKAGGTSMAADEATRFSLAACDVLWKLAISRANMLEFSSARQALSAVLDDARPEVVKAAGGVLGVLEGPEVQSTLLQKGSNEQAAEDIRVALYKDLAANAKHFGNKLNAAQSDALRKTSETDKSLPVRSAAAEAHGALNLPPDEVKSLIINSQAK